MTITKTIEIDVKAEGANKEVEKLNKNLTDSTGATKGLTSSLDSMTGGAISGFSKMTGGVKTAIAGFKSLKIAIAATGIGLLVIAIGAIATAFKSSEEGQNKFAKLMGQIKVVTGNVIDIFASFGESLMAIGKALARLAKGDIKGAKEAFAEFKTEIKETGDSIKNFGKETKAEFKIAAEIADKRAKATKLQRQLIIDQATAERDIAELRDKATRKDLYNAQQRKEFLEEAGRINDKIINQQIEAARLTAEAITAENSLSKSTKEDLDAEANAKAELIRLETARATKSKQLGAELSAINQSQIAEVKALAEAKQKAIDDELEARRKFNEEISKLQEKDKDDFDKKQEDDFAKQIEFEKKQADQSLALEIENNRLKLEESQKAAEAKMALDELVEANKYRTATMTSQLISQLVGQDSKIGKELANASTVISGIEGVQNAFTTASKSPITAVNPAYPFIQAGLAGAFSLSQIAKIKSTDPTGKSGGGGGGGSQRTTAPSFNLVQGSGTNQIAQGLNRETQVNRAYVVSSDVSTAQELDRKIVAGASL